MGVKREQKKEGGIPKISLRILEVSPFSSRAYIALVKRIMV